MSGIEVASFILGVFPLIIAGIDQYQKGLEPLRKYLRHRQELIALKAFITTEQSKFVNSIDSLLQPLVAPVELYHLIRQPEKIQWKAPHLKASLSRRLGPSEDSFYAALQVVESSLCELKLLLDPKDFLDRLSYSFTSGRQEKIRSRLSRANEELHHFVADAKQLGTARERRILEVLESRSKRAKLSELYWSLPQDPSSCECKGHLVHLDLRSACHGSNEKVIIGLEAQRGRPSQLPLSIPTLTISLQEWSSISKDAMDAEAPRHEDTSSGTLIGVGAKTSMSSSSTVGVVPSSILTTKPRAKLTKKSRPNHVAFELSHRQPSSTTTTTMRRRGQEGQQIHKICATAVVKAAPYECVGYLRTPSAGRMQVHALPRQLHRRISPAVPAISLDQALGAKATTCGGRTSRARPQDILKTSARLRTAATIASLFTQVQSTPWLESNLDRRKLCFLSYDRDESSVDLDTLFLSKAMGPGVCHSMSSSSTAGSDSSSAMSKALAIMNESKSEGLFCLGKLLIELAFNTPLESLYEEEDKDRGLVFDFTPYLAAKRLLPEIYEEHGHLYGEAVRRCIEGIDVREKAVEHPDFRRAFNRDVLQPLQDVCEFYSRGRS